jgi:hypothetical protein
MLCFYAVNRRAFVAKDQQDSRHCCRFPIMAHPAAGGELLWGKLAVALAVPFACKPDLRF